jgi:UDP-glucose 4-epimerase
MTAPRWLITGGCGFIGVSLINELFHRWPQAKVRVVDNLSVGKRSRLESVAPVTNLDPDHLESLSGGPTGGLELVVADVRHVTTAFRATAGADIIVHLAANTGVQPSLLDPTLDLGSNVVGTFNYLEAARRFDVRTFVFASSGAPTGTASPPITEDSICRPISPYGASKLAGEAYCSAYYHSFGLNTIALRFSNVYGPLSEQKDSVVAKFFRQALNGQSWVINGDGSQTRDFIFNKDLVDAIIRAALSSCGGELFQISTGKETSIHDLATIMARLIAELTGIEVSIRSSVPLRGDMLRNYAENRKARDVLGWTPRYDLEAGLRETLLWFAQRSAPNAKRKPENSAELEKP